MRIWSQKVVVRERVADPPPPRLNHIGHLAVDNLPHLLPHPLRAPDLYKTSRFIRDLYKLTYFSGALRAPEIVAAWGGGGEDGSGTGTSDVLRSEKVVVRESSSFKFKTLGFRFKVSSFKFRA